MSKNNNITESNNFILNLLKGLFEIQIQRLQDGKESNLIPRELKIPKSDLPFFSFIKTNHLEFNEIVLLSLALVPHINPSFLGNLISNNLNSSGNYPEIGCIKDEMNRYFLPTGETIMFLLSNSNLEKRGSIASLFSSAHLFSKNGIISLAPTKNGIPTTTGRIIIDDEFVELFLFGKKSLPNLSIQFPATHLTTQLEWKDLILPNKTLTQIQEIKDWVNHQEKLMQDWGMSKKLKPGYRALFYGVPGTGKTLTATLLGKYTGLEVFKIDLSMVVSKYIGETEKNLATLFNKAQNKNWILFFDEADALFGKRTNVRDAHDKYANQEVSYLLQRIENYPGLIILASNFKTNIDAAFTRRFQSIIAFTMPQAAERLQIWKNAFPKKVKLSKAVDIKSIAEKYELSGSNIMNVVQFACLKALAKKTKTIKEEFILKGIQKEFEKEGKMF